MIPKKPASPPPPHDMPLSFTAEKILQQLQRIMDSDDFHATESQRKLLEYVVHKTIAEESDQIKGYTIATTLFGRKENIDLNADPIVSVHANKLRRALERYYFTAGIHDLLRIEIPKGTYVPLFKKHSTAETEHPKAQIERRTIPNESPWPTILIRPFQNLTQRLDENYLSIGLATELAVELNNYRDIRVIMENPEGYGKRTSDVDIRFTVDGTLRNDGKEIRLSIYLLETISRRQLWGESHRFKFDLKTISAIEKQTAQSIAAKIAGEYGIISQTLSSESKTKPPDQLKTYEAILRYYEFDRLLTEESFMPALEALEYASTIEPDCGQVWSMLGDLYGNIYAMEMPGFETALEKAVSYAEKGAQMNPDCQKSKVLLSYVRMLCNELPSALAGLDKTLALNPGSFLYLDGIGYLLILLGDWERGTTIIRQVIQQNPYYSPFVHYALWVDNIRQKKYDQAHLETLNFSNPSFFWEPMMKASTFGLFGRREEGEKAVQQLLTLKPDFQTRGRILIGHYIKFDDIVERVIEGLCKAGMTVD